MKVSRRTFVSNSALAYGASWVGDTFAQTPVAPLTVDAVLQRIKDHVGVPWRSPTVDNLLSGNGGIAVRGIATTMMATFAVCKRAQALGCNLLITHETPFYLHQDKIDDIRTNAVLEAKQAFLAQHEMAVFHFHDHLHAMPPDGVAKGMIAQLGWQSHVAGPEDPKHLHFEGVTLAALAQEIAAKLGAGTVRVVGDPAMPVHTAQTSWGYCSREGGIAILSDPAVEVLICGETREWELVEYAQDAIAAGQKKALIVVGHVLSEQGGMIFATDWLKGFVPEVPVRFVPAEEPFWRPDHPRALPA